MESHSYHNNFPCDYCFVLSPIQPNLIYVWSLKALFVRSIIHMQLRRRVGGGPAVAPDVNTSGPVGVAHLNSALTKP